MVAAVGMTDLNIFNYYHPLLGGRVFFHLSEEQRAACDEAPSVSEGEALAEAVKQGSDPA